MPNFIPPQEALDYLSEVDWALGKAIANIGPISVPLYDDLFCALVRTIAGQQLSVKAQAAIIRKMEAVLPYEPQAFLQTADETFKSFGFSTRKIDTVRAIARSVQEGSLAQEYLASLSDQEIYDDLLAIKGIGPWTADMMMMFSLARPDVFPTGDLAVRRGLAELHGPIYLEERHARYWKEVYSPYGSTAAHYLWILTEGAMQDFTATSL